MPLLTLVVILIVVGVGLWLINRYIPMASGLWGEVTSFRVGR